MKKSLVPLIVKSLPKQTTSANVLTDARVEVTYSVDIFPLVEFNEKNNNDLEG